MAATRLPSDTAGAPMSALTLYETLSDISGHMVLAAETGDWDRLIELERTVVRLRDKLSRADGNNGLSDAERARKAQLIKGILADDRKIRSFTEPWMENVRRFLGDASPGRDARKLYTGAGY